MYSLSELSTEELEYLRSKWSSEITELKERKTKRLNSVNNRLTSQEENASELQDAQQDLQHAQALYDHAVTTSAPQAMVDAQQDVIDELQRVVDSFSASSAYVSKTGALIIDMELREIESSISLREADIATIDSLL